MPDPIKDITEYEAYNFQHSLDNEKCKSPDGAKQE